MNPQAGQQGGNPFMAMLQQMQAKRQAPQGGQGSPQTGINPMVQALQSGQDAQMPQVPGMSAQGAGGAGAKMPQPSNVPGGNPGSTQSLVKALAAMNQVITDSDDPQEVQMVRQIIIMIQQLIQQDQQKQGGKESALGQAQNQSGAVPPQIQGGPPTPPTP